MTLKNEDREVLVSLRMKQAKETFAEVGYWRTAVNRLYYACYYAVSALLMKNGHTAHTHSGVITQLGLHFVTKGIISMEKGKLYRDLFEKRQTGDYDVWVSIDEKDVAPFVVPAEKFIAEIDSLISRKLSD